MQGRDLLVGVLVFALLGMLVAGATSWQMRITLVAMGGIAALTFVDLPFPEYHLMAPLAVLLLVVASLNRFDGGRVSAVLPLLGGITFGGYYLALLRRRHNGTL